MERAEISGCLAAARDILARIRANTDRQERLIPKRQMTGLRRLLQERQAMIGELAAIKDRLREAQGIMPAAEVKALEKFEQEVLAACTQLIRRALAERAEVAAELMQSRVMGQAKNRYLDGTKQVMSSRQLNIKA